MTQENILVSPNVSACLKPGAWKTQPALGLSPAKLGGTHHVESPNLSGSFCISPFSWRGSIPSLDFPGLTQISRPLADFSPLFRSALFHSFATPQPLNLNNL